MFEEGYIRMEEYYCDGTVIQANANKYKVTWKKNLETMKEKLEDCSGCPFHQLCGTGQREESTNRIIRVNKNPDHHKQRIREKLKSKKGRHLYEQRGHDVESCFGDIKMNQLFRRVHLRGLKKVETEFIVIAMAHNLRKMQINKEYVPQKIVSSVEHSLASNN
ncbi:hypothetical protein FACS1894162_4720 [Bacteroidia bacterium]|nr:hypothetical protein FACS1894162_4720 [Bacteroidia bacterium]